jgi:hypothetical protein
MFLVDYPLIKLFRLTLILIVYQVCQNYQSKCLTLLSIVRYIVLIFMVGHFQELFRNLARKKELLFELTLISFIVFDSITKLKIIPNFVIYKHA